MSSRKERTGNSLIWVHCKKIL